MKVTVYKVELFPVFELYEVEEGDSQVIEVSEDLFETYTKTLETFDEIQEIISAEFEKIP